MTYPFRAAKALLQYPTLRPYVIAPVLLNLFLGITLYAASVWWGLRLIEGWMAHLADWVQIAWLGVGLQVLAPIIQGLLVLAMFVITGLVLLQFGVILGSPFYGQLSEKLESLRVGQLPPAEPLTPGSILRDIRRAILFELKKLALLATIGIPLLALNLLPGLGTTIATVGGLSLATTLLCLDMFDAALERRRLKFRQKLRLIFGSFPASAGFGLVCLGLVSIPLMNLLAIPLCVTAGTLFFCDRMLVVPPQK
ncbi:MAG: EI24 domain-containing protein [Leptolyngbyaceae cyanobacterium]